MYITFQRKNKGLLQTIIYKLNQNSLCHTYNTSYWPKLKFEVEFINSWNKFLWKAVVVLFSALTVTTTTFEFYKVNKEQEVASGQNLWSGNEHVLTAISESVKKGYVWMLDVAILKTALPFHTY